MLAMNQVPYRPAISDLLVRASASTSFRSRLLAGTQDLTSMGLCPEELEVLNGIQATTLGDYAGQVRERLLSSGLGDQHNFFKVELF